MCIRDRFEAVKFINSVKDGKASVTSSDLELLTTSMSAFVYDIMGILPQNEQIESRLAPVMDLILDLRKSAREQKDWDTSDKIRDGLSDAGITVKDGKEGTTWS